MTSPQPALPLPGEGNTPPVVTATGSDNNPNIEGLTAVGNTEDALQNAKIVTAEESKMADQSAMAAVAPMFDIASLGGLQLAQGGLAPAANDIFGSNMDGFQMLPTTAQDLEALAAVQPLDFDAGMVLNQLQQNRFGGMPLGIDQSLGQLVPHGQQPFLDPSPYMDEPLDTAVRGFAKLEFGDGEFYMNTFAVVLGRDEREFKKARKREKRQAQQAAFEFGQDPRTPKQIKREESQYSKSIISESAGIMRDGGDDPDPEKRQQRRLARRKNRKMSMMSRSDGYSSHSSSKPDSYPEPIRRVEYKPQTHLSKAYKYALPMTEDAVPVDPDSLCPDPRACPLIPIHPDNSHNSTSHKSISREHLKIAFNPDSHVFEGYVIGRNGVFHSKDGLEQENAQHYVKGSTITLTSNCYLQIADVVFKFMLPDIPDGETGELVYGEEEAEQPRSYSEGGKEMSFDFENDLRPVHEDSDEESDDDRRSGDDDGPSPQRSFSGDDQMQANLEGEENEEEDGEEYTSFGNGQPSPTAYHNQNAKPRHQSPADVLKTSPKVEKKRGPGRPPKDGIMSKREKQLVKKEAMAQAQSGNTAAKTVPHSNISPDAPPPPVKNKVGRPRKHPLPEVPEEPRQKRKYTKRKPKEPKDGEVKEEGSGGDNPTTPAKKEKPPKEPQEPPLKLNEADYTEEQLQKPVANYVMLIFEALSNHPDGQMSLPQIYRAIEERYPWFHFKAQTNGWQSSVRHNLGQNNSFTKVMRDGKGWKWALVPGATIEKEKKRRATPPPQAPPGQMQQIYSNPYHMMPGQPYHPHMMGPPGGYHYGPPPNMPPGQYPYMGPPAPHMGGQPHHPSPYNQLNGPPPGVPAIMPPQLAAPNAPSSYSSPYAPKPPSANESQPNGQRPPTEERRNSNLGPSPTPSHVLPQDVPQGLPQNSYQGPSSHGHTPHQGQEPQTQPQQQPQPQSQSQPQAPIPAPLVASQPTPLPPPVAVSPTEDRKPSQSNRPVPNTATLKAVKQFKDIMLGAANTRPNVGPIIDSATSQVLGYTDRSTLSGEDEKFESQIKQALITMLQKISGANIAELLSWDVSVEQKDHGVSQVQVATPDTNQNGTQASAPPPHQQPTVSTGSDRPASAIMRPQINGHSHSHPSQNRPNIPIPRPPMMGPGNNMKRTSSGSPAPWGTTQSGSPAKQVANGASAPVLTPNDYGGSLQTAGQKRTIDEVAGSDADDMRDLKRLSTSGPPQVKT